MKKGNVDEFEELLNKFNSLSIREIDLLYLLFERGRKTKNG